MKFSILKYLFRNHQQHADVEATKRGVERSRLIDQLPIEEARERFLMEIDSGNTLVHRKDVSTALDVSYTILGPSLLELLDRFELVVIGEHYSIGRELIRQEEESSVIIVGGDPQIEEVAVSGNGRDTISVRSSEESHWKERHKSIFHLLLVVLDECEEIEQEEYS